MNRYFLVLFIFFQIPAIAQTGTDIILFDVTINAKGIALSNPVNITNHKGYDNQPFFYKKDIYYSSAEDSAQMDIKKYGYGKKATYVITHTVDNEFSPTITPDGKFISCILQRKNGKQDLVKYPVNGGEPTIIIDDLKVGYHAWATNHSLLLFVLEDTSSFGLHSYNISTKEDKKITTDIGRSLQKVPGKTAVSFIQKTPGEWLIKQYDVLLQKESTIMPALPKGEFHTWTKKGLLLMGDGQDIYFTRPGNNKWQKVNIKGDKLFKNISRIAINEQNTKLAVVISE